ncbi:MAG: NADH-quinone oxidoreductase subunit NuoH [Gaiellaceae bacterium]
MSLFALSAISPLAKTEAWWIGAIEALVVLLILLLAFAYMTLIERKLLGRLQLRFGPNRAGPFGIFQPFADLIKLVRKEPFQPDRLIHPILYLGAPVLSATMAFLAFSVIPWGGGWVLFGYQIDGQVVSLPISLIVIFAIGSISSYGVLLGGWVSESKYALLGAMRSGAQLVSYEVSLALSVLGVVLMARSLSLTGIVAAQQRTIWYIVPQIVGFACFTVAGVAEVGRAPFDLPEAEQELVAGFHTEYSGMRWGLYQIAEYIHMMTISALMVTLFFGGWLFPVGHRLGPLWFLLKLAIVLFCFIWARATLPRLRYDQLMDLGWKVILPVATVNAVATAFFVVLR